MKENTLTLILMPDLVAVCRLAPETPIPKWALESSFYSISKTKDELSIVCEQSRVPTTVKSEPNWRCLKVKGTLDFGLTGILASLANPLAQAGISIFAISTFDTDYLMVKQDVLATAMQTLTKAGHLLE